MLGHKKLGLAVRPDDQVRKRPGGHGSGAGVVGRARPRAWPSSCIMTL